MNKAWYVVLAVVVVVGAFLLFAPESAPNGEVSSGMPVPGMDTPEVEVEVPAGVSATPIAVRTIRVTANGFEPGSLTIAKGGSVTWVNESGRNVWPASAMHPTHAVYPTTGGCVGSTFDACRNLAPGESWSFVFDEIGTWKYHDHLRASVFGSVTVE